MKFRNYLTNIDSSYLALGLAILAWSIVAALVHISNVSIPPDFKPIRLNEYHQAYEIYIKDSVLILRRTRGVQQELIISLFTFISTLMIANCIAAFRNNLTTTQSPKRSSRPGQILILTMWGIITFLYVYPSITIVVRPQALTLDLNHNKVLLNDKMIGVASTIARFEDVEASGLKSQSSQFRMIFKDGSYLELTEGIWVGGNLPVISAYLNQYLQTHPTINPSK